MRLAGAARYEWITVTAGALLEVDLPQPESATARPPELVEGLVVLYEDDDVLVVDKPAGPSSFAIVRDLRDVVPDEQAGAAHPVDETLGPPVLAAADGVEPKRRGRR